MVVDLEKEFSKKSSVNFRHRRTKYTKPDIIIVGNNDEYFRALKAEHVVELCNGTTDMEKLAQELGCTNVDCATFHVESQIRSEEDMYNDNYCFVDRTYYFLVATEK